MLIAGLFGVALGVAAMIGFIALATDDGKPKRRRYQYVGPLRADENSVEG